MVIRMAIKNTKRQAKKFLSKPEEYPNHKFWELEKLAKVMKDKGHSAEEIQAFLIKYINNEKEKCSKDPIYFATTYGFIVGRGSVGITPFCVHDYQKELLSTIRNNKFTVNAKSRQLGCSTVVMFYALWFSIFSNGKRTLVVAHRKESAKEFIAKLKVAYEYLPEWLKPAAVNYSMDTIEFDTNSRIKAITSNPHAARSFSATLFILDEAAFIDDANKVVEGIMPTLSGADGKLVAISSPNGDSPQNWFYTTFSYAKEGKNGWAYLEFPWNVCPDYTKDPNFERDTIKSLNGDRDKFLREYCCSFNVRIGSLFSKEALASFKPSDKILNKCYGGITYENTYWMWKAAEPGRSYTIGVDCSANKSTSRDFSAFVVLDSETQEQMAEYQGKLSTDIMTDILIKAARHYNNAQLVIEENNYSEMLFYLLEVRGYTNFWYQEGKSKPGFNTNRHSRILLIEKLLLFFNKPYGMELLRSKRLKDEFENFVAGSIYADGSYKYEAGNGAKDDICMACAMALVPLTPREREILDTTRLGIAIDAKDISSGSQYTDEYIEHNAKRMGVSPASLRNRLSLYHDIKTGRYDGSGLEELELKHPVEEFDRLNSIKDFIGVDSATMSTIETDTDLIFTSNSVMPVGTNQYVIDDIFSESFQKMLEAHNNFFNNRFGRGGRGGGFDF